MDTLQQLPRLESKEPIESDVSEALPLKDQIEAMEKPDLIKYMESLGYNVDRRLGEGTIRENIFKIIADRKGTAQKINEESLEMAVTEEDPMIEVRFFNMESPGADESFSYSGKRGMYSKSFMSEGKKCGNPNGFKKCPRYHLFPGEIARLAYSVYEHLVGLTYVTHKTVFDPVTGMIQGNIPIIKPRFILQPILSKADIMNINKNR